MGGGGEGGCIREEGGWVGWRLASDEEGGQGRWLIVWHKKMDKQWVNG